MTFRDRFRTAVYCLKLLAVSVLFDAGLVWYIHNNVKDQTAQFQWRWQR